MFTVDDDEHITQDQAALVRRNLYWRVLPGLNAVVIILWLATGITHHDVLLMLPLFALLAVGVSIYSVIAVNRLIKRQTDDKP